MRRHIKRDDQSILSSQLLLRQRFPQNAPTTVTQVMPIVKAYPRGTGRWIYGTCLARTVHVSGSIHLHLVVNSIITTVSWVLTMLSSFVTEPGDIADRPRIAADDRPGMFERGG